MAYPHCGTEGQVPRPTRPLIEVKGRGLVHNFRQCSFSDLTVKCHSIYYEYCGILVHIDSVQCLESENFLGRGTSVLCKKRSRPYMASFIIGGFPKCSCFKSNSKTITINNLQVNRGPLNFFDFLCRAIRPDSDILLNSLFIRI